MSIESVVDWANKLKRNLWWLHAIRLAAEKGELGRDDFELLFKVAKIEHGLEAPLRVVCKLYCTFKSNRFWGKRKTR